MPTCIYCLEDKDRSEFSKDHVIPEAFGRFRRNLTLIETVCKTCNSYFGEELEFFLGRDTFEGALRFVRGVKDPKDLRLLNRSRIRFRLNEEGTWKGAIMQLKYAEYQKRVVIYPVPQVGFRRRGTGEWKFFEVADIKSKGDLERQGFVVKGKGTLKMMFGPRQEERRVLERGLKKKGINVDEYGEEELDVAYSGKEVKVEVHGTIDKIICRGIAKIAFNYLAYTQGKAFALDDNFVHIRDFIRHGNPSDFQHVLIQNSPVLHYEKRFGVKETLGHLITLGWDGPMTTLVSEVALFNVVVYRVIFCRRFRGLYRPISSGHHFDVKAMEVSRLRGLPKGFYVP